jgi:hypothetical protein
MARRAGFTSYDDDETFEQGIPYQDEPYPDSISYRYDPPHAGRTPEERLPLFLSNPADEPEQPNFGRIRPNGITSSLVFKAGLIGVALAAIAFGLLSAETPLTLFADAKASLPATPAPASSQPLAAAQPQADVQIVVKSPATAPVAAPTREEMVAAFNAARQGQPDIRPPVAAAPAPVMRRLDPDEMAALLTRAKSLMAVGDIAPARLLLERAADAQEPSAALLLAQSYDPAVLGASDMRSIIPDPAMARRWYQKASQLGSPDAQQRLAQLGN